MKKVLIAGLLAAAATTGCADSQRWQSQEYQPNMTGDIWAPRADWKYAEDQAKQDWQNALKKTNTPSCLFPCIDVLNNPADDQANVQANATAANTPANIRK